RPRNAPHPQRAAGGVRPAAGARHPGDGLPHTGWDGGARLRARAGHRRRARAGARGGSDAGRLGGADRHGEPRDRCRVLRARGRRSGAAGYGSRDSGGGATAPAGGSARARCGGGAGRNDPRLAAAALQSGGDPRERVGLAPGAPVWVRELGRADIVLFQVGRAVPTTPWELVLTSSRETKFVLAILVVFSIVSWYLIFLKWWQFRRMRRQADRFMTEIERAARLDDAYHAAMRLPPSPYNRLLREGIQFFSELKPGGLKSAPRSDGPVLEAASTLTTTQLEALRMVLAKEVAAE